MYQTTSTNDDVSSNDCIIKLPAERRNCRTSVSKNTTPFCNCTLAMTVKGNQEVIHTHTDTHSWAQKSISRCAPFLQIPWNTIVDHEDAREDRHTGSVTYMLDREMKKRNSKKNQFNIIFYGWFVPVRSGKQTVGGSCILIRHLLCMCGCPRKHKIQNPSHWWLLTGTASPVLRRLQYYSAGTRVRIGI